MPLKAPQVRAVFSTWKNQLHVGTMQESWPKEPGRTAADPTVTRAGGDVLRVGAWYSLGCDTNRPTPVEEC